MSSSPTGWRTYAAALRATGYPISQPSSLAFIGISPDGRLALIWRRVFPDGILQLAPIHIILLAYEFALCDVEISFRGKNRHSSGHGTEVGKTLKNFVVRPISIIIH